MGKIASYRESDERYPTLRIVGAIFSWAGAGLLMVGTVLLALGLYGLVASATGEPPRGGGPIAAPSPGFGPIARGVGGALSLFWSIGSIASGLQFLMVGSLVRVAIDVEENTRASAQCLERLRARLEPREEGAGPWFTS
jgi:hypothetical protein